MLQHLCSGTLTMTHFETLKKLQYHFLHGTFYPVSKVAKLGKRHSCWNLWLFILMCKRLGKACWAGAATGV